MKPIVDPVRALATIFVIAWIHGAAPGTAAQTVAPFGFTEGAFSCEQTVSRLSGIGWPFTEYGKNSSKR